MNYTTIEQSKRLVELGLNPESADMCYPKDAFAVNYDEEPVCHYSGFGLAHPCWSLGALLEVMPTQIEEIKDHKIDLILGCSENKWCLAYFDWTGLQQGHNTTGDTPIEAAYNMVCWLLENDYIKKGE